ncbi:MAG: Rieske 2Fe-2S domain-containing protein [Crocosphaera sp.]|nr:Rieske 2Fe-2S domain-containing protein [Crocosphaera sp.]
MTVASNEIKTDQTTESLPKSETEKQFNWKECWYPVTFIQDLPTNRPYGFTLYDEPLVLFRNKEGKLICLKDLCPHRAAKLSDGQIIDGKIECLYHGWQFGNDGQCVHIPQLAKNVKIPVNACIQAHPVAEIQGMVWIWAGTAEMADEKDIPTVPNLNNPTVVSSDYMLDLPYDQGIFIENILDPAHIFISHNGSLQWRADAQPLEMEILKVSLSGIESRYRRTEIPHPEQHWVNMNFIAPNLVTYTRINSEVILGSGLYSLPTGKGRCRIMLRNYTNISTWKFKLKPRWFEHWYRNKFVEEDLSLVVGQAEQINRLQKSLKKLYLPLRTSDLVLIEYRKWLDKYGGLLPFYQGYETSYNIDTQNIDYGTRLTRHTQICGSCNQAYENTKKIKKILIAVAILLAAIALVLDHSWVQYCLVAASLLSVALVFIAEQVKIKFERAYTRH